MERFNPNYKEGLTDEQVNQRIKENLINYNLDPKTLTVKEIIKKNCITYFNILNIILCALVIISGIIYGKIFDSIKNSLFMGVIFANTIISIVEEILAKKEVDKLSLINSTKVTVIRDGEKKEIDIEEIVLDDIIYLNNGMQIITDCIIKNGTLEVNESFITGEEDTITKKKGDMLLSGSFVISGEGYAKVEHIGIENYTSKISIDAKYVKKANSLIMKSFEKILKWISYIIIPIGLLLFITSLKASNYNIYTSVVSTVAALIGMIPEGLILLTSSVMAISIIRISKYKVLVKELHCIESLARVDTLCLDKTGTITEGNMKVIDVIPYKTKEDLDKILTDFCSNMNDSGETFKALKNKYNGKSNEIKKDCINFSSERKYSAILFDEAYFIGAYEFLNCEKNNEINKIIEKYEEDYRVLVISKGKSLENNNLKIIGFILIEDVIRPNTSKTLSYFKKQNVDIKIISGDNYKTVGRIASKAGLDDVKAIDASTINDDEIDKIINEYNVFGRVTPHQKKKFILSLQKQGHTVAMTGDGVNDVLALKSADCSIALANGTEATRNVSDLVLLNSNFDSMPKIVKEGRRTINNIERSSSLLLSKTIYTLILIFICIFTSSTYFFIPIQLTLITAFTIGIPSFILALEPNNEMIKGNFLKKIISKSLPSALTVVFNIIMVMLFKYAFNFTDDITSSLTVFLTGTTGFIFLYRICIPFNKLRLALFSGLIFGFTYITTNLYEFFSISAINLQIGLLFFVLFMCSIHIYNLIDKIVNQFLEKNFQN